MNVVIPMAGNGRRFWEAGFKEPKPLIDVLGRPMIERVVECINIPYARYIFIVQQEHIDKFGIDKVLRRIKPDCEIEILEGVTQGAAETVLCVADLINTEEPLLICNSDQYFTYDVEQFTRKDYDAKILTFFAQEEKWSYAKTEGPIVTEVAEKRVISNEATVGLYMFERGWDFVTFASMMIHANDRTNGEFYVCPVFNWLIAAGRSVGWQRADEMYGLGTPEDYCKFIEKFQGKL